MQHRHLNTSEWSLAAIDSVLEYGDLPDWKELFAAAKAEPAVAKRILHIATSHDVGGASALARELVLRRYPGLSAS